jgi:hypothetical protein
MDMPALFATTANLFLTCVFYSPLIPLSIPIGIVGMFFAYWVDKHNLLRLYRVPEMMSGMVIMFLSNLVPYFALLWGLSYFCIFDVILTEGRFGGERNLVSEAVPIATLSFAALFVLLPVRTMINSCMADEGTLNKNSNETYTKSFEKFTCDYDRENPVTKKDGFVRMIEAKLKSAQ